MRQIFLFIAIILATASGAQRHTPVEIKQLAYRNLPRGQKPLGLDLDKYIAGYMTANPVAAGNYEEVTSAELADLISAQGLTVGKREHISIF